MNQTEAMELTLALFLVFLRKQTTLTYLNLPAYSSMDRVPMETVEL